MEHPINEIMKTTIEQVREMVDANTIIGEPIACGEITLIPVSRISIGFGTGGSELPTKQTGASQPFGGGGGAGIKVEPVAFLSVNGTAVKVLPMTIIPADTTVDRLIEMVPDLVEKVTQFVEKRAQEKEAKEPKNPLE